MYMTSGQGQTTAWDQNVYINNFLLSIWSFAASYFLSNDFLTVSHINIWVTKFVKKVKVNIGSSTTFADLETTMFHAKFQDRHV